MSCLIHPTYFPNIAHFTAIANSNAICFEVCDNYQKQSFRNRAEIYGANGKIALSVPVNYTQKHRQLYKDVKIANEEHWQQLHLKSLQSAYRMSPFFEYYIDDLMPLFENKFTYLLDLNLHGFDILTDCLQIDIQVTKTETFEKDVNGKLDYRTLADRNYKAPTLANYTQVFTEKHGFISNLSILDLLFNEGPNSELYLTKQTLS